MKLKTTLTSSKKDDVNVDKQCDEVESAEISNESTLKNTLYFAQEINSVSARFCYVLYQIKNKCLFSTAQNEAKALPNVGDRLKILALRRSFATTVLPRNKLAKTACSPRLTAGRRGSP
jgi:hypothetical protein